MEQPIYMKNEEWWTIDKDGYVVLTDKAPQEAVEAYNKDISEGILLSIKK